MATSMSPTTSVAQMTMNPSTSIAEATTLMFTTAAHTTPSQTTTPFFTSIAPTISAMQTMLVDSSTTVISTMPVTTTGQLNRSKSLSKDMNDLHTTTTSPSPSLLFSYDHSHSWTIHFSISTTISKKSRFFYQFNA